MSVVWVWLRATLHTIRDVTDAIMPSYNQTVPVHPRPIHQSIKMKVNRLTNSVKLILCALGKVQLSAYLHFPSHVIVIISSALNFGR
jgi:hypothetical protein